MVPACGLMEAMITPRSMWMIGLVISRLVNGFGPTERTKQAMRQHLLLMTTLVQINPSNTWFLAESGTSITIKLEVLGMSSLNVGRI